MDLRHRVPRDDGQHHTTIEPSRSSSDHLSPYTVANPEAASMVAEEDSAQHDSTHPFTSKEKPHRRESDLDETWIWEIAGAVLSLVGIGVLIWFLIYIHEKPYANWQYTVAPNTVISIISAITKAALLSVVSACLGQLKWRLYRKSRSAPLEHIQTVDEASRGSWGSLKVFWGVVSGSKMGILIFSGAWLTILALAVDPFAQQILSFPSRQVQALNETAFIQSAVNYTAETIYQSNEANELNELTGKAITSALSIPQTGLQAHCARDECSYPRFVSLGICDKCEDVTKRTTQKCKGSVQTSVNGTTFDMNCTYTAPYHYNVTLSLNDLAPAVMELSGSLSEFQVNLWASYVKNLPYGEDLQQETYKIFDIETPIVSFILATQDATMVYTTRNTTAWPPKPSFTECALYWCEKEYAPSNFSATSDPAPVSRTQQLQIVKEGGSNMWVQNIYKFVPPGKLKPLSNKTSTYHVSEILSITLIQRLANLFNITASFSENQPSVSAAMYDILSLNNITDIAHSLSLTLTDTIRAADVGSRMPGKAFRTETYIHVRWPWIILPIFVVLASILLLLVTTIATRHDVLWKNSLLPLLRNYFDTAPEGNSIALESVYGETQN